MCLAAMSFLGSSDTSSLNFLGHHEADILFLFVRTEHQKHVFQFFIGEPLTFDLFNDLFSKRIYFCTVSLNY